MAIKRTAQGKLPPAPFAAAAAIDRRNGAWAAVERQVRQLRGHLVALRQELHRIAQRLPYATHLAGEAQMRKEGRDVSRYWCYSPELRGYLRTQPDGSVTVSTKPPLEPPKQSPADEALAAMRRREARDREPRRRLRAMTSLTGLSSPVPDPALRGA